jgi:hypothetical protein
MKIPKIIHQMWIGPIKPPLILMNSWKEKNPDFEYIYWNEDEIIKREMNFKCLKQINEIQQYCGKCDIMRWEILYKYGGIFVDADTICIEPFDDYFMCKQAFATYENESQRKGLVANSTMGFIPKHPLCRDIIEWIADDKMSFDLIRNNPAWLSVGPNRLTKFLETGNYPDFSVFPSYCYLPIHHSGVKYEGHHKVYAHHEWGSNFGNHETLNERILPKEMTTPTLWFSVIISTCNAKKEDINKCLGSILNQNGWFGIELVWNNNGSDDKYLEDELHYFRLKSRFTKIVYLKNQGLSMNSNECSHDYIFSINLCKTMTSNYMMEQVRNKNHISIDDSNEIKECVTSNTLYKR